MTSHRIAFCGLAEAGQASDGVSYLAIKNKTVLGSYSSYAEALHETEKSEPIGSFIIQFCNGNETGYTNYISSMFVMGA